MKKPINWGVLGAGTIAKKFVSDFKWVQNGVVIAIGSRSYESAKAFSRSFGIEKCYGSYMELINDAAIDIIYIATPHSFHFEHVLLCLRNNKNVLCEKPITVNASQLELLIWEAKKRNLYLMEAMWTPFLPAIQKAQQWIAHDKIGTVQLIQSNFGFVGNPDPNGRLFNPELAGGSLLDIGIYPLTIIEMFAQSELNSLDAQATISDTCVDESLVVQLSYKNGVKGQMATHFKAKLTNVSIIYGTKGWIQIPLFWMSKRAILHSDGIIVETFNDSSEGLGYNFEIEAVNQDLLMHSMENGIMSLERSLKMMHLMDKIRSFINLTYPFE